MSDYQHIVNVTLPEDTRTVYDLRPGCDLEECTEEELRILYLSMCYRKQRWYLKYLRVEGDRLDLEKKFREKQSLISRLKCIPFLPRTARKILKEDES